MIANQLPLIKRELWEHRSIYLTPAAIGIIMIVATLTGQVSASAFGAAVDVALVSMGEMTELQRRALMHVYLIGLASTFLIAMWILAVFYSLDCLYAERKDKSILFWRSLPVTDAETVISKLLVALVVIPAATFIGIIVTHLLSLVVTSFWLRVEGGSPMHLIWSQLPLFDAWLAIFIFLVAWMIWMSPFIGWFLLASAYVKRSPLLLSSMPIALLPMLEKIVFGSGTLFRWFFVRPVNMPLFGADAKSRIENFGDIDDMVASAPELSLLEFIDLGWYLSHPGVYGGVVVCAAFTAGAIWIRRYRDDS